jgi:predicted TPR repeat methyltransferase
MNKDQLQFLVSGVLFGFLVGYLIAYAVHEPRVVGRAAPVPMAGNMGMSGGPAGAAPAGMGDEGAPVNPHTQPGGDEQMKMVFQEIAALKEAIAKDPKNVQALTRMANLYHDSGMYDKAVEFYENVLAITPADVNVRTDMGICIREMGNPDEAIAQFRKSISYQPEHWQSWLNLGVVSLFDKQDAAAAAQAFAKVEEINPGFKDLPALKDAVRNAREAAGKKPS